MHDPKTFGPFFPNKDDWKAWRAFLAAVFALPMPDDLLEIYQQHTYRMTAPTERVKEAWMVVGRRGGKSRVSAFIAVYLACFRDYRRYLAPGETAMIPILAADKDQAGVVFGYVMGFLRNIPMLSQLIKGKPRASEVDLVNGVTIRVRAASFRTVRGPAFPAVICDEIAFWYGEDSSNPDREILDAVRPGMLTIPGSLLIGLSSPYARRGVLWEAYDKNFGREDAKALVWKGPTTDMNPCVDRDEIAKAYAEDDIAARSEYGAEFRDDLLAFVPAEVVDECMKDSPDERPPQSGVTYEAFCDPSGGSADSFTLAIAHMEKNVAVLDRLEERRPPFSPDAVVAEFSSIIRSYGCSVVGGDRYAGEWPRERFSVYGVSYKPTEFTKSEMYQAFLPLLMARRTKLVADLILRRQLIALDRRPGRAGRDTIDHPPGGHDDVANAATGAILRAAGFGLKGAGFLAFIRQDLERIHAEEAAKAERENPSPRILDA
jgi:hypothetical protein